MRVVVALRARARRLYAFWKRHGDWQPAGLTKSDVTLIVAVMIALMLVRALDYIIGNDERPLPPIQGKQATIVYLSDAFPLWAWGAAILSLMSMLLVGAIFRRHVVVYLAHGLSVVLYFALFVGTLIPILSQPYLDGIRGASPLFGMAVLHAIFTVRTGPRPLRVEESVVEGAVRRPA